MADAPERFSEGARVGHFRLEKTIGRGGMGVVWSAVDERDGGRVALKFLDDVRRDDPVSHARFLREAELATKLTHPNIVHVHTIDYTLEGTPFLVMDLLEGESLRARMKLAQRLSPKECGAILGRVASAAKAAHEAGIVHRDLKPENVFLTTDGGVRVLDFGVAKRLSADEVKDTFTSTGAMLGTPAYMAPEQIFGERDIDGKVDVWALGVIVYECLTGVRPVEGGVGQILKATTSGRIVPLGKRVKSPELSRFVMKMLATEPAQRPSMAEVEQVLEGLRDDVPAPSQARRVLVAGAAAAFALGFGVVVALNMHPRSVAAKATVASETVAAPSITPVPSAEPSAIVVVDAAGVASVKHTRVAISDPPPPPSSAVTFTGAPEFDVVLGRVAGMGNQTTQSDVGNALRAMKPCLPAPTSDERWTIAVDASWPKGRARTVTFEAHRNAVALANARIEACAKRTFDAASIATPDGQDDAHGTSYVRMSVGYF